jgi:major type 1 subunit fimbrin (pilin)
MNIRIKQTMIVAGLLTAMALPMAGQASDGTITFSGAVVASTCSVKINGATSDETVTLPTVDVASLSNATTEKQTGGGTFFKMTVGACTGSGNVSIYFEAGPTVDQTTGGLINTATSGSNVEVNLYNASGSAVVGTQILPGSFAPSANQPATLLQSAATGAGVTQWFYAGYSTAGAGAAATAGAVSTTVTYSLIYS